MKAAHRGGTIPTRPRAERENLIAASTASAPELHRRYSRHPSRRHARQCCQQLGTAVLVEDFGQVTQLRRLLRDRCDDGRVRVARLDALRAVDTSLPAALNARTLPPHDGQRPFGYSRGTGAASRRHDLSPIHQSPFAGGPAGTELRPEHGYRRLIGRATKEGARARQRGEYRLGPPRIAENHLRHGPAALQTPRGRLTTFFFIRPWAIASAVSSCVGENVAHHARSHPEGRQQAGTLLRMISCAAVPSVAASRGSGAGSAPPFKRSPSVPNAEGRHPRARSLAHEASSPPFAVSSSTGEVVAYNALPAVLHREPRGLAPRHQRRPSTFMPRPRP